ncbi:MAG TPA: hypothetical protein VIF62_19605 [Labilithrix sp.]|jgi:hypothetical protein
MRVFGCLFFAVAVVSCHPTDDIPSTPDGGGAQSDSGGGGNTACYIAGQQRCHEFPQPTGTQANDLAVECSSDSGMLGASCPTAGFLGKCTLGSGAGREIRRFYTGADAAYQQDFCVNTAMGLWTTTF